jgi:putative membrane protein
LVAWLSNLLGADVFSIDGFTSEGLEIASFGWAILAALVMSVASFVTRSVLKVLKIR